MARQNREKKVRVRVLPLKGIGGIGNSGDTAWLPKTEADYWAQEGYVEILPDADEPVPSSAAYDDEEGEEQLELGPEIPSSPQPSPSQREGETVEDHKIMKPENKRGK